MKNKNTTLSDIGELSLIARIRAKTKTRTDVITGIGDDCAVVRMSSDATEDLVLKSDPILGGHHFLADTPPEQIGHKALARVLSDIASMGATPRWVLVDLVAPDNTPINVIDGIYKGLTSLAEKYECALVGGDTAKGETLELHVFGAGSLPRNSARLRSAAQDGDAIYVTGLLGSSFPSGKHLTFSPRVAEGQWLRNHANAMIDISDSLASELWHLAEESQKQLMLDRDAIPCSSTAQASENPLARALFDGEDFELLFTIPHANAESFEASWKSTFPTLECTRIGFVYASDTPLVRFTDNGTLPKKGFDHFLSQTIQP